MDLTLVKEYMTNDVEGVFVEQSNGACPTIEFKDENDTPVRFVVCAMDLNLFKRRSLTTMYQETKIGDRWIRDSNLFTMTIDDNCFLDSTGEPVLRYQAFETVEDRTKPIEGTDPVEFEMKEQLKEGHINEVDTMITLNSQLFTIIKENVKKKVSRL